MRIFAAIVTENSLPESQADTERVRLDTGQEVPEHDSEGAICADVEKTPRALQAALESYRANEKLVQMLLAAGADVNAQGGEYDNALYAASASYEGGEEVVQMLLAAEADVNAQCGQTDLLATNCILTGSYL